MKQTAVEWLIKQISGSKYFYHLMEEIESKDTIVQPNVILQQAKEMEKKQIMDAYNYGVQDEYVIGSQQYYKETFKSE